MTSVREGLAVYWPEPETPEPGIVEIRILKTPQKTVSGYFDAIEPAARAVEGAAKKYQGNASFYATLNPVIPAVHARAANRLKPFAEQTTTDAEILRLVHFLIDVDPVRPAGVSSTDAEVALALATRDAVVTELTGQGWPAPMTAMSGNGGHARYRIDLSNDAPSRDLVKACLAVLHERFATPTVTIDRSVFNPARICKVYGTIARKGDPTADRPHRRAEIETRPIPQQVVTRAQLQALAALGVADPASARPRRPGDRPASSSPRLDMRAEFEQRGLYLRELSNGRHAVRCPWAETHSGESGLSETALFDPTTPDGWWGFKCQHAHCADRTIRDVWELFTPTGRRPRGVADGSAGPAPAASPEGRQLRTIPATAFQIEPVRWLSKDRIPLGAVTLLGGREGIGKSLYTADLAARVTRGTLPGALAGEPRAVFIVATEDSWKHTIVPRLMAAGADLTRVFCVEVVAPTGVSLALSLPQDLIALEQAARDRGAALLVFDPLISRLDSALDTHKDASVRQALEPLVAMVERLDAAAIGLIHVSKSQSLDPLTLLMGSRAFAAVARAVLFTMIDPDDDTRRLLGQPKNTLGRTDLSTLTFAIQGVCVATTDKGEVWTGHLEWGEPVDRTIHEALESLADQRSDRGQVKDAETWLFDYLTDAGGTAAADTIIKAGQGAGFSRATLYRARTKLQLRHEYRGFPRTAYWTLLSQSPHTH